MHTIILQITILKSKCKMFPLESLAVYSTTDLLLMQKYYRARASNLADQVLGAHTLLLVNTLD